MIITIISFGNGLTYDCHSASETTLKDMDK